VILSLISTAYCFIYFIARNQYDSIDLEKTFTMKITKRTSLVFVAHFLNASAVSMSSSLSVTSLFPQEKFFHKLFQNNMGWEITASLIQANQTNHFTK
jgi:hypothetical protein